VIFRLLRKVLRAVWEYPVPSLVIAALLGLIAFGGSSAGWSIWGWHHYQEAQRALERGDLAQAQAHLARCLEVRNNSAETHFLAARTARRAGNFDDAERHLKESQRLGELRERIDLERALLRAQRGDLPTQIESNLQYFVEQDHPDTVLILEVLAKHYIKTYQMVAARNCLNIWLAREPENIQALMWRAETNERLFVFQEAQEDFGRVVALDPQHEEARLRLGEILVHVHQPEEALPHFRFLVERRPEDAAVLLGLARCFHLLNQPDEAVKLLDKILTVSPNDPAALGERGRLAFELGQLDQAEHWLRKAWNLAPYEKETTYSLFLCLKQLKKDKEAKEILAKLDNIENQLSRLKEITRAISGAPHDPALRHEAGMIFLRSGQAREGLRWLNSALQEDPRHQPTHQALLEYYESIGDEVRAAAHRPRTGRKQSENPH
jgi:tetratricopeptide (TPR) repeat protein